jgi:hypothetical protein
MIVPRKGNDQIGYSAEIPEGTKYESAVLNPDGLTYTLTGVESINGVPVTITAFQGKEQLRNIGKYDQVIATIDAMISGGHPLGARYKNAFETIPHWKRNSETIQNMAGSIGIVGTDLDNFFIEAKKIELP